ncbi:MAG TPA: zinc-ribbon domain-containing protein [Edaphocola sp.]|nr:zinc-ribbon domain-containing protein [Edaphocola sp.]
MAIINCSECGKEVSDKAEKCPNCGNPINPYRPILKAQQVSKSRNGKNEGCFLQTLNIGCIIIFIIILIILISIIKIFITKTG